MWTMSKRLFFPPLPRPSDGDAQQRAELIAFRKLFVPIGVQGKRPGREVDSGKISPRLPALAERSEDVSRPCRVPLKKPRMNSQTSMKLNSTLLAIVLAMFQFHPVEAMETSPSFPPVSAEPLGRVSPGSVVLWDGWQMRESALIGTDGAAISHPGCVGCVQYTLQSDRVQPSP